MAVRAWSSSAAARAATPPPPTRPASGAEVTLIERDIVGGAAHLWDCIPSKTMIATGGAMSFTRRIEGMGLAHQDASLDVDAQRRRVQEIEAHLNDQVTGLLESQGVRIIPGSGRLKGPHEVVAETDDGHRGARRRRHRDLDRQPAPDPGLGPARRRADPHHPAGLPAAARCPSTWS